MKNLFAFLFLMFIIHENYAQSINPNLDTSLANTLGADDYGMKKYVFVILKTGDNKTTEKYFIDSCFKGHMSNMDRLVGLNKLVIAGGKSIAGN